MVRGLPRGQAFGGSFVDLNNLKDVPGFVNLKQEGNNLVEFTSDPVTGAAQVSRLFLDPNTGDLFGATRAETIRQLKEFFLVNLDKFRGNAGNAVRRFLQRNGAANALFGNLTVDLDSSVIPLTEDGKQVRDYAKGKERAVRLAALNFLLNTVSQSRALLRVQPGNVSRNGIVGLNLNNFMNSGALALITNNNPYACSGTGREPFRLDLLISRAMDPEIYYQLIGAPRQFNQLAAQLGVQTQRRATFRDKIVVAGPPGKPESIVGQHPERMLWVQNEGNIAGGSFYMSFDNKYNLPPGVQAEAASTFRNGVDTSFAAGEMIFHKPNGFLGFYLAAANGNRADSAPVEIARASRFNGLSRREGNSNDVSAPVNCLVCHSTGLLGGGKSLKTGKAYTDNFRNMPANHQQFFTTNAAYAARAKRDSDVFMNALIRSGSYIPDAKSEMADVRPNPPASLLPDFVGEYNAPLTVARAAQELGVGANQLAGLLRTNPQGLISRRQFESSFCGLKRQLGGSAVASGFQQNIQSQARQAGLRTNSAVH